MSIRPSRFAEGKMGNGLRLSRALANGPMHQHRCGTELAVPRERLGVGGGVTSIESYSYLWQWSLKPALDRAKRIVAAQLRQSTTDSGGTDPETSPIPSCMPTLESETGCHTLHCIFSCVWNRLSSSHPPRARRWRSSVTCPLHPERAREPQAPALRSHDLRSATRHIEAA